MEPLVPAVAVAAQAEAAVSVVRVAEEVAEPVARSSWSVRLYSTRMRLWTHQEAKAAF
jgi:hypothetical protein